MSEGHSQTIHDVIDRFLKEHNYFEKPENVWENYTLDMTIEAIINYSIITSDKRYIKYVERFFHQRGYCFSDTVDYRKIPFSDAYFLWYQFRKNGDFIAPYLYEGYRIKKELVKTKEGAICIHHQGGNYLLIDYLQTYGTRMSRAGYLSGDTTFFEECVKQFELYRQLLKYEESGLYSQGRGWLEQPEKLSPSCWSRGQGWLIRGMVSSLEYLPENSDYEKKIKSILVDFADALIKKQDENGMWRTLPCKDLNESFPEVSGTALIAYNIARAYSEGYLTKMKYKKAAQKAVEGIKRFIYPDGSIDNISPGPGPLRSVDEYKRKGNRNDKHGPPTVVYGMTVDYMLD